MRQNGAVMEGTERAWELKNDGHVNNVDGRGATRPVPEHRLVAVLVIM